MQIGGLYQPQSLVRIGSDLTYPPYEYMDASNVPAGFDVELVTAIAKAAGLEAKFLDTRFDGPCLPASVRPIAGDDR